jgi:DNA (cytosine-5)-methyltransferase 1
LAALAGEDEALVAPRGRWENAGFVDGPQRAVAWRVLDAQYFGVAQRRRRLFVIASARDDFDPAAVLFEFEGLRRDIAPSREKGQNASKCITTGVGKRYDAETDTMIPVGVAELAPTILSSAAGYARTGNAVTEHETYVPMTRSLDYEYNAHSIDEPTGPLLKGSPTGGGHPLPAVMQSISIHPHCIGRSAEAGPQGKEYLTDGSAYCMDGRGQPQAVAVDVYNQAIDGQTAATLTEACGGTNTSGPKVMQSMAVRRLTPVECERLQGFPDNYTNIKENCPDGPRYKALGNSWAVPVVRWIGKRIARALA